MNVSFIIFPVTAAVTECAGRCRLAKWWNLCAWEKNKRNALYNNVQKKTDTRLLICGRVLTVLCCKMWSLYVMWPLKMICTSNDYAFTFTHTYCNTALCFTFLSAHSRPHLTNVFCNNSNGIRFDTIRMGNTNIAVKFSASSTTVSVLPLLNSW
jgi:hypothetical protein